jgi:hypothetical protein
MRKPKTKKTIIYIGTMEVARLLNCHPMSIPRYVRTKPGFPKPGKLCGKNVWDKDVMEAYRDAEVAGK